MNTQFGLLDRSYKLTKYGHLPSDDGIAGHIHLAPVGKNGPTIIALGSNAENSWSVPDGALLTEEQYQQLLDGELYVNVHRQTFKSGKFRGQLRP